MDTRDEEDVKDWSEFRKQVHLGLKELAVGYSDEASAQAATVITIEAAAQERQFVERIAVQRTGGPMYCGPGRPLIYVVGPYRARTVAGVIQNINRAKDAAQKLWQQGWTVLCPHMNTGGLDGSVPDDDFLAGDREMLVRCDAVFVMEHWWKSEGSRAEIALAARVSLPVAFNYRDAEKMLAFWRSTVISGTGKVGG